MTAACRKFPQSQLGNVLLHKFFELLITAYTKDSETARIDF